jgi:hypothetical protein
MNTGFWSPAAEHWFQTRLELIRSGRADLKNSKEWTANLKLQRKGAPLTEKHEAAAVKYISGVVFYS